MQQGKLSALKMAWAHPLDSLWRALNVNLPSDVVIKHLEIVSDHFHPRFDACSRQYQYTISTEAVRDVLRYRYTLHFPQKLDLEKLKIASKYFLGTRDFYAFGKAPQGDNTVRTITQAEWFETPTSLIFEIRANAFLYRMVRNIVGTLLRVGLGKISTEAIKDIILLKDRNRVGPAAEAKGLCLVEVTY